MAAIETQRLSRRYGRKLAVDGLDLSVAEGSVFALLGPNGAGKTTTIKLLLNLLAPSGGSARVLGTDTRRLGPGQLARIGYVSENQRLPLWMTVAGLIDYCRPMYPAWDRELERTLLEQFELQPGQCLRHLSRGILMRAALLVSLAYRPELLILDEPFSGLDPLARDEFSRALAQGSAIRPGTILISSHDIEEVEKICDHIGVMDSGRLAFSESAASLLARHRRVEAVAGSGALAPSGPLPASWTDREEVPGLIRFADNAYAGAASEETYRAAFPGAAVTVRPMTLREIFIAQARTSRTKRKAAA